jgi:hypothetical protein
LCIFCASHFYFTVNLNVFLTVILALGHSCCLQRQIHWCATCCSLKFHSAQVERWLYQNPLLNQAPILVVCWGRSLSNMQGCVTPYMTNRTGGDGQNLWGLRFSQQHCWRYMTSGTWFCVTGQVASKALKAVRYFETSGTAHPGTECRVSEWNVQTEISARYQQNDYPFTPVKFFKPSVCTCRCTLAAFTSLLHQAWCHCCHMVEGPKQEDAVYVLECWQHDQHCRLLVMSYLDPTASDVDLYGSPKQPAREQFWLVEVKAEVRWCVQTLGRNIELVWWSL